METKTTESKERLISNLLCDVNKVKQKNASLIEELDKEPSSEKTQIETENNYSTSTDGPSMLDLMMEAQKAASKEHEKEKAEIEKKEVQKSFSGFKKGFFGGNKTGKAVASSTTLASSSTVGNKVGHGSNDIIEVKPTAKDNLSSGKQKTPAPVLPDVQNALQEEENQKLSSMLMTNKEWMTNDLMNQFKSNAVLARGFQNPKCMAAMQLLQSDPKEALTRFQHDEEVSVFLKEFGSVMSGHFMGLAEQQQQKVEPEIKSPSVIQEIGPLQAQALKSSKATTFSASSHSTQGPDDEQVRKVSYSYFILKSIF